MGRHLETATMPGCNVFVLTLGIFVLGVLYEVAIAQSEATGEQTLTSCPDGVTCAEKVCMGTLDGDKTCCRCTSWTSDGDCLKDSWSKIDGPGNCDFATKPAPGLKRCPPGVECDLSKCTKDGGDQTCCQCGEWQENGMCDESSWIRTKGKGKCDVVPGDGARYVTAHTVAGKGGNKVAEKDDKKANPTSKLDESAEADANPDTPILQSPEFIAPVCKEGAECDELQCTSEEEKDKKTCCGCGVWDEQGQCLPGSWTVKSGPGNCDFLLNSEPHLPISVPRNSTVDPKQLIDPLPFIPCPPGISCETTKCATTDGTETCCDCVVWKANGRCDRDGWRARNGNDGGGCKFAHNET